jgi:hypothetical protein
MGLPKYELPPPDPRLAALTEQTKQQDILAIQDNIKIDTASIMARYGNLLTMAQGTAPPSAPQPGPVGNSRSYERGGVYG